MNCEKLLHGDRTFKPYPEFGAKVKNGIDSHEIIRERQDHYPYKCLRRAKIYKVSGQSFTAFAVLCKSHAKQAEKEGFILEVYIDPNEQEGQSPQPPSQAIG